MPQIYGYAFHSPIIISNLVPLRDHIPIYLDSRWLASDIFKNVNPVVADIHASKILVVLAGSLPVLQSFLKRFSDIKNPLKVVLFENPGFVHPFRDPLLTWVDCDHQAGGAWQITKTKLTTFEALIESQDVLTSDGKDLIFRMQRVPLKDKISDIEAFQDYMPSTYKDLLDYDMSGDDTHVNYDAAKDVSWKKRSYVELLKDIFTCLHKDQRAELFNIIISYQLNRMSKREYNLKLKPFIKINPLVKKPLILLRKWMDDGKRGQSLYGAYLDYVFNLERRCWRTILDEHNIFDELDLLIVIAKQSRSVADLNLVYAEDLAKTQALVSDMFPPEKIFRWGDESLHYHPEIPNLKELFDT